MASNTVHAWLKRAMCPAEEEAFLRESEAYAEHLGAALPRLLPPPLPSALPSAPALLSWRMRPLRPLFRSLTSKHRLSKVV